VRTFAFLQIHRKPFIIIDEVTVDQLRALPRPGGSGVREQALKLLREGILRSAKKTIASTSKQM